MRGQADTSPWNVEFTQCIGYIRPEDALHAHNFENEIAKDRLCTRIEYHDTDYNV